MPRIVLTELDSETTFTGSESESLIGRDPACHFVVDGPKSKVVSGRHARLFVQDNTWWIEDWSRNGTVVDHERLQRGVRHALREGQIIGLGDTGPRYRITALDARQIAATLMEMAPAPVSGAPSTTPVKHAVPTAPRVTEIPPSNPTPAPVKEYAPAADPDTMAMRRSEALRAGLEGASEGSTEPVSASPDWIVHVVLRETHTNHRYDVRDAVVKIGRAPACLVQIPAEQGASVSRVHSEIAIQDGGVFVRDASSRNGTYFNGKRIDSPVNCVKGDLIMLGAGGPTLAIEDLHIIKANDLPDYARPTPLESEESSSIGNVTPPKGGRIQRAMEPATRAARRSLERISRPLLKPVVEDMSQQGARRLRIVVWSLLAGIVALAAALIGVMQAR